MSGVAVAGAVLWQMAASHCERKNPDVWKLVYPRIYEEPGKYYSPRFAAAVLASEVLANRKRGLVHPGTYQTCELIRLNMPTYFVARDLLRALDETVPPDEIDWQEMEMPSEGLLFILPRGLVVHPEHGAAGFISLARHKTGVLYRVPYEGSQGMVTQDGVPWYGVDNGMLTVKAAFPESTAPEGPTLTLSVAGETKPKLTLKDLGWVEDMVNRRVHEGDGKEWYQDQTAADKAFEAQMLRLALSLVFVMLDRPALVERGAWTGKRAKSGREFWSPNVIGPRYQYAKVIGPHGTHASPRGHFRRAHWREQAVGPKQKLHRRIWIERVFVGVEEAG